MNSSVVPQNVTCVPLCSAAVGSGAAPTMQTTWSSESSCDMSAAAVIPALLVVESTTTADASTAIAVRSVCVVDAFSMIVHWCCWATCRNAWEHPAGATTSHSVVR